MIFIYINLAVFNNMNNYIKLNNYFMMKKHNKCYLISWLIEMAKQKKTYFKIFHIIKLILRIIIK